MNILALLVAFFSAFVVAYHDNCKGSSYNPPLMDCWTGYQSIDEDQMYAGKCDFSFNECYIVYTDESHDGCVGGVGITGKAIKQTVYDILDTCYEWKGSFGTYDCDDCHVTVNYRTHID
ncbi:hypothetical protein LTR37_005574 [Vermiconidia calcicola]|uniref:Uncharacterized protein n=1 Tax=Vermiconidia calcicola TaxID=1690605 RepID=A0ACC3NJW8_9PEZI|nr:hypothetical protein LTR37_005574 [Vermiconidia calcicola]